VGLWKASPKVLLGQAGASWGDISMKKEKMKEGEAERTKVMSGVLRFDAAGKGSYRTTQRQGGINTPLSSTLEAGLTRRA